MSHPHIGGCSQVKDDKTEPFQENFQKTRL